MSQNNAKAGIEHQQKGGLRLVFKKNPDKDTGDKRFQKISEKDNRSRLHPQPAERIGRPRVAASVITNVYLIHPAVHITGLKQAE